MDKVCPCPKSFLAKKFCKIAFFRYRHKFKNFFVKRDGNCHPPYFWPILRKILCFFVFHYAMCK